MTDHISQVQARIDAIAHRVAAPAAGFAQTLAAVRGTAGGVVGARSGQPPAVGTDLAAQVRTQQATLRASLPAPRARAGVPPAQWAQHLPEAGRPWAAAIEAAAQAEGVAPTLLAGLVWAESGFAPEATSHAGAIGLGQLMPSTADGLGVDPHDPEQNLRGAARYLRIQLDRFGREDHALAAYNAGPGRVQRAGGIPDIAETQAYVPRVLAYRDRLEGRP